MGMAELGGHARYAIYWTPPAGSWLEAFGASWLGWDAEAGERRMQPALGLPLAALTAAPARYGFHATLKAPFRLAPGRDAAALDHALAAFAERTAAVEAPMLALDAGLGFVALRPSAPSPAVDAVAFSVVEGFEPFRAPLTPEETARRRQGGLDPAGEANLAAYGYAHVGDAFRFHLTLTGPVDPAMAAEVIEAASPLVGPHLENPFRLREIALFGDPGGGGRFRLIRRYPLTG